MPSLLTINWNPDPELFNLFGSFPIRYYGLLWGIGIVLSCIIVQRQYRDRKSVKTSSPRSFSIV